MQPGSGTSRVSVVMAAIIVILFVSFAPIWILSQRSQQRTLTCQMHQIRIVEAFQRYDGAEKALPGFRQPRFGPSAVAEAETPELASWTFSILPYLYERRKPVDDGTPAWHTLYDTFGPQADAAHRKMKPRGRIGIYLCPSDTNQDGVAPLSFVANAAMPDNSGAVPDYRANGLLMDRGARMLSWSLKDLAAADGVSHTILLTENIDAGDWHDDLESLVSLLWRPIGARNPVLAINERIGHGASVEMSSLFARPSSYHPGGVNVAFPGGSTRVLTPAMDKQLYLQLLTADDLKVRDNVTGRPLTSQFKLPVESEPARE